MAIPIVLLTVFIQGASVVAQNATQNDTSSLHANFSSATSTMPQDLPNKSTSNYLTNTTITNFPSSPPNANISALNHIEDTTTSVAPTQNGFSNISSPTTLKTTDKTTKNDSKPSENKTDNAPKPAPWILPLLWCILVLIVVAGYIRYTCESQQNQSTSSVRDSRWRGWIGNAGNRIGIQLWPSAKGQEVDEELGEGDANQSDVEVNGAVTEVDKKEDDVFEETIL